jgi:hypothetical protein
MAAGEGEARDGCCREATSRVCARVCAEGGVGVFVWGWLLEWWEQRGWVERRRAGPPGTTLTASSRHAFQIITRWLNEWACNSTTLCAIVPEWCASQREAERAALRLREDQRRRSSGAGATANSTQGWWIARRASCQRRGSCPLSRRWVLHQVLHQLRRGAPIAQPTCAALADTPPLCRER